MKKIFKFIALVILIGNCSAASLAGQENTSHLLGDISKTDLKKAPFSTWFDPEERSYQVDDEALAGIDQLLDGVEVKVVLGTWCHDSKREVPRFYKIIEATNLSEEKIQMIALDRKKQAPGDEIDGLSITHTATFIFYRHGEELNRIVEKPTESLEKDMVKILRGEEYRHSKLP